MRGITAISAIELLTPSAGWVSETEPTDLQKELLIVMNSHSRLWHDWWNNATSSYLWLDIILKV